MAVSMVNNTWTAVNADEGTLVHESSPVFIHSVEFSGYTTGTHTCVLKDKDGDLIVSISGSADLDTKEVSLGCAGFWGIEFDTIDSGTCLVHLAQG